MPSVNEAQRRKMFQLYKEGKITKEQMEHYKKIVPKPKKKKK